MISSVSCCPTLFLAAKNLQWCMRASLGMVKQNCFSLWEKHGAHACDNDVLCYIIPRRDLSTKKTKSKV